VRLILASVCGVIAQRLPSEATGEHLEMRPSHFTQGRPLRAVSQWIHWCADRQEPSPKSCMLRSNWFCIGGRLGASGVGGRHARLQTMDNRDSAPLTTNPKTLRKANI
jgi:hypothetical protein